METLLQITNLPSLYGKKINAICDCNYIDDSKNHCAHFVSHVMGYRFGFKCKDMTGLGDGIGANIRVYQIFSQCQSVGLWTDDSRPAGNCLAFITKKSAVNLVSKTMANIPSKHVGIYYQNYIYHYSNSKDEVVRQSPHEFAGHYKGDSFAVFYGTFP